MEEPGPDDVGPYGLQRTLFDSRLYGYRPKKEFTTIGGKTVEYDHLGPQWLTERYANSPAVQRKVAYDKDQEALKEKRLAREQEERDNARAQRDMNLPENRFRAHGQRPTPDLSEVTPKSPVSLAQPNVVDFRDTYNNPALGQARLFDDRPYYNLRHNFRSVARRRPVVKEED
jgi:hypothetical protein|tara:strand:- start:1166 stop:1684 length:519 start_codon:yes stop_codon:yes gene_type:complete